MLRRRAAPNGVIFYASPLLERVGVPHAFSTRLGGTSPPPFDSLNLGNPTGCAQQDDYPRILSHYRLLQEACGCPVGEYCRMHQVHGSAVHRVRRGEPFDRATKGDAIVSDDPTRAIVVRVADCAPVLITSDDGKVVAAVHAGWRGVVADVLPAAVKELRVEPNRLIAAIGPCIGADAFEVGGEVLQEFEKTFGEDAPVRPREDRKGHVDLRECLRRQLLVSGVRENRIDVSKLCTFQEREQFFSHRRDRGVTGRMAAMICAR